MTQQEVNNPNSSMKFAACFVSDAIPSRLNRLMVTAPPMVGKGGPEYMPRPRIVGQNLAKRFISALVHLQ
jgi:hypothetical protein